MIEFLEKYKSLIISLMLIFSLILVLFSFVAPYILTQPSNRPNFDFTKTGSIGDTLGGIMNPFIALAGVLLTFLAFYMQIEANKLQIKIFQDGLNAEKEKKINDEKEDCLDKLSLLELDINSIISDVENNSIKLDNYYNSVRENTLKTHVLKRTLSKNYTRTLNLDRLSIYKGFQIFSKNNDWIKLFNNLYISLDFLEAGFLDLYGMADKHAIDIFHEKADITNKLNTLREEASKIINDYLVKLGSNYLNHSVSSLLNEMISRYTDIIQATYDENNIPITETNLNDIHEEVLNFFINQALKFRGNQDDFYTELTPLVELASEINKQIFRIQNRELEVAQTIEDFYKQLNDDSTGNKSVLTSLQEIRDYVNTLLLENRSTSN